MSPKDQLYPNKKTKQRTGNELKCVYIGQDLSIYDELVDGFDHLFLQPCFIDTESVEWNGKNFAKTESVVKNNPQWRLSLQTHTLRTITRTVLRKPSVERGLGRRDSYRW